MLSRPSYTEGAVSDVCAITVDFPSRKSSDIRKGQLEDEELKKIIDCFESMDKNENFVNYTSRVFAHLLYLYYLVAGLMPLLVQSGNSSRFPFQRTDKLSAGMRRKSPTQAGDPSRPRTRPWEEGSEF
ncbi:hypothetical protein TNCV_1341971 [Trichonephila clavipes]|uniref:Uncharacterized protein n=1 Tax=Trichonephila clavipes TaxID=2585209 RepID=A0A8X6VA70_TRICX|nr:hypothetical protein TNCV_1341971 [Trichonephila clavipes]